jgi:hypothetical protein
MRRWWKSLDGPTRDAWGTLGVGLLIAAMWN